MHRLDQRKNDKAYEWLSERPVHEWSRSHFKTNPKCDMLFNKFCECFNKYILDARDKHILTICEIIRCKLMHRFFLKRNAVEKYNGLIFPRIQKKLDKINSYLKDIGLNLPHKRNFKSNALVTST